MASRSDSHRITVADLAPVHLADLTIQIHHRHNQRTRKMLVPGLTQHAHAFKPGADLLASLYLKGDWLAEAGFDTGTGVTVKISEGCLILIAERDEVQELRKELYQVKQVVKGMRLGVIEVIKGN
ncbi:SymE family type I addiction module toxin [Escherichia marmotae]|uniref:SymE family type I addiction module toxin n=1 Tax=Escherichia marmotae TaxID=1499973 RepID=A0AAW5MW50_9ESCH|nr:SymE family type I addiction module toxin [Escherichia marmotae]